MVSCLDKDTTLESSNFSTTVVKVRIQNEDGTVSEGIKERTYDLKIQRARNA